MNDFGVPDKLGKLVIDPEAWVAAGEDRARLENGWKTYRKWVLCPRNIRP